MNSDKKLVNLIIIGHVDHGKSTFVGRLLMELGVISKTVIEKYKTEAKLKGKSSFEFAWVMDNLKEERERGITISLSHKEFSTERYNFTIIDARGHKDFVKNMITGASQADAAMLLISAKEGIMDQTKEHLFIIKTFGIKNIIIGINKFDEVEYSQKRYEELKEEIGALLKQFGINPQTIPFLPISAYYNANITEKRTKEMRWYTGKTVLEALNSIEEPKRREEKPLRLRIEDVYVIQGVGVVPVGRVESGVLSVGQKVVVMRQNLKTEVKTIEMHHKIYRKAYPGMNIGLNLKGISKDDIRKGDMICDPTQIVAQGVKKFLGQIMIMPGAPVFHVGYTRIIHCHTAQVACRITKIVSKIDVRTGSITEQNRSVLKSGDAAIVEFEPLYPLVIERISVLENTARFAVRDMGKTLAAGRCIKIEVSTKEN